jgi:hypothetical protein
MYLHCLDPIDETFSKVAVKLLIFLYAVPTYIPVISLLQCSSNIINVVCIECLFIFFFTLDPPIFLAGLGHSL